MNSKLAYIQPYNSQVVNGIYYYNMWLCLRRKSEWENTERIFLFSFLLISLYYFIELYVKINRDVG